MGFRRNKNGTISTVWVLDEMKTPESIRAAEFMDGFFQTVDWEKADVWPRWKWSTSQGGPPAATTVKMSKRGRGKGRYYDIRVRVRKGVVFPCTVDMATSTVQVKDRTAQILTGRKFWYEFEKVVFADVAEVLVYYTGIHVFKALRFLNAVPGRASRVGSAKYGVEILGRFRKQDVVREPVHA